LVVLSWVGFDGLELVGRVAVCAASAWRVGVEKDGAMAITGWARQDSRASKALALAYFVGRRINFLRFSSC